MPTTSALKAPDLNTNVARLDLAPASETRISQIKRWYVDQVVGDTRAVAIINITLTEDAVIQTHGVGLEPDVAAILLDEIDRVRRLLQNALTEASNQPSAAITQFERRSAAHG